METRVSLRYFVSYCGITAVGFYGEPGHGRRLVDAMSSFGCKHSWFPNANHRVEFLKKYFPGDNNK